MAKEMIEPATALEALEAARAAIPSAPLLPIIAETFQALGDMTRVRLLYVLTAQSLCVGDLAAIVGASESAVSHHLRILRDRRLVKTQRAGTRIYYALGDHMTALLQQAGYHADHIHRGEPDHGEPKP